MASYRVYEPKGKGYMKLQALANMLNAYSDTEYEFKVMEGYGMEGRYYSLSWWKGDKAIGCITAELYQKLIEGDALEFMLVFCEIVNCHL